MSSGDSSSGSDSDLDDVQLFYRDEAPTPKPNSKPAGLGFRLGALPAHSGVDLPLQSPRPSARAVPGLSLKKGPQPNTPDPGMEPLPSSRGARPEQPAFKLGLPPRPQESVPVNAEDSRITRTTSDISSTSTTTSTGLGTSASRMPSAPAPAEGSRSSTASSSQPPPTSRLSKPPKLQLQDPATASPKLSPLGAAPMHTLDTALASANNRVVVSLLSSAFAVNRPSPAAATSATTPSAASTIRETVAHRCAHGLGIAVDELRFFELRELVADQEVPASARHVAVLVNNSGFSLPALEEMLANNQQLQATQQTNASTIATMHNDYKASQAEVTRLSTKAAEQDKELEYLKEKLRRMEAENAGLKDALQRCDDHRQQLTSTIATLKTEFTTLMQAMPVAKHA